MTTIVSAGGREPGAQGVALAAAFLLDHADRRHDLAGDRDGVVGRPPVDQNHLIDPLRDPRQHVRQVPGLVLGGNDDTDGHA